MNDEIWTSADCAAFLRFNRKYFLQRLPYFVGFPKPLEWSVKAQPRWSAAQVKDWALRQIYANAA